MEIKKRITFQFILMVALINVLSSLAIYISFSQSRQEEFYDRLTQKAQMVSQMLADIDEINVELLRKIEQNNPLSLPNEKITIFDYNNELLFTSDTAGISAYPKALINKVRLEDEIRLKKGKSEVIGFFYTGQYDRIVTFVAATDIFGIKKLKRLRIILLVVFFASLIVVYFSGRIFANRSLHPITMLMDEVDKIQATELSIRLNTGENHDEIAKLAQTFNRFLNRLESAINMQKNFIANASHELRTPLTVLSGQLEVLLRKQRTGEEYRSTIATVFEEIKNLSEISNRLLLLARASAEVSKIHFTDCRIDDILWQTQSELKKRHAQYMVQIYFSEEIDSPEKLTVKGNEVLLKTAFLNLIDNACKYSANKTCIVRLGILENEYIQVRFEDSGIGISDKDLKFIFQPFYRSEETINIKGHGIGLSLVEKIILLHKGKIQLHSVHGQGTEITINFQF